jgi:Tol biopolymer transport system component
VLLALGPLALLPVPLAASATGAGSDPAIAFASSRSGNRAIWTIRPSGTGLTRVTAPPKPTRRCDCRSGEFDSDPAWSPDGRRIGFTRGARVYVTRADGSDARPVGAPPGSEDFAPAWSKDGRLAFIRQRPAATGSGYVHEIVAVDRDGRRQRVLGPASRYAYRALAWSPDGRRLAYAVPYTDPGSPFAVGLFVVDAGDGRPRFVLRAVGMGEISWSPDGTTVALAASVPGAEPYDPHRLFTIRLRDRKIVQLTRGTSAKVADGAPRWSPGGGWIAFTRTDPRHEAVHVVRPDGSGERLVARNARGAAWSPAGDGLAARSASASPGASVANARVVGP